VWKRELIKRVKESKVISGKSVITQHRLMIMVVWCCGKRMSTLKKELKTRWWKLIENEYKKKAKETAVWNNKGNINGVWKKMATYVKNTSKRLLVKPKEVYQKKWKRSSRIRRFKKW